MTPDAENWELLQTLFHIAEETQEADRDRVMQAHCPDPEIRARAMSIFAAANLPDEAGKSVGRTNLQGRVGPYSLIRLDWVRRYRRSVSGGTPFGRRTAAPGAEDARAACGGAFVHREISSGAAHLGLSRSPKHHAVGRCGPKRYRAAVPGNGVCRRRPLRCLLRLARAWNSATPAALSAYLRSRVVCASQSHRSSGSEAFEYSGEYGRNAEAAGFWNIQADPDGIVN